MAESTICLMIPTIGRPTLARTLASVRSQPWACGDRVMLIGDGPCLAARALWNQFKLPGMYHETDKRAGDWGHTPRNIFMPQAQTTHIAALDDDDVWTPDALRTIRTALKNDPDRCHIFQMDNPLLWSERVVRLGNVGTPMFVLPSSVPRGTYTPRYGGDFDFIRDTLNGADPIWHEKIICVTRPILSV